MNDHPSARPGPRPRTGPPAGKRWAGRIAALTGFVLLPGLLTPVAFAADPDPLGAPALKPHRATKVHPFTAKTNAKSAAAAAKAAKAEAEAVKRATRQQAVTVTWPTAGEATLTTPARGTSQAAPGALPVTLAPPTAAKNAKNAKKTKNAASLKVGVLDQKRTAALGVKGVVLTATAPADGGNARLGVDYTSFASAYGGDWAGRLRLVRLPACALTRPDRAECRTQTPLPSANDRAKSRVEADVSFAPQAKAAAGAEPVVFALAAGTKSGAGDYKATPLSASSTWEAGGSSGTFTWSYPMRTPSAAAGPKPDLALSYDSGSVDGRTANTNNQGTVIGEGFDITSSYIERKYGTCDDDGQTDKYDLCWKYENASLVLGGKATELVKDDTTGKWRLKNDDASTVIPGTGATNGDDNGEYWTVITGDGTKYVFGLNKLEGATTERTQSVWTVPVFGDDSGEPGYADGTTFSGRSKQQAWRWNLDYVVDTHGNAMTYWYETEGNHYDKLGDGGTAAAYHRGGYLREIRYGQRAGALFTAAPAASHKVAFGYTERCVVSDCATLTETNRDNWPDVPFDALCEAGKPCTGNVGPTFFTRKRMTSVTTHAWDASATAYAPVDEWQLKHVYLDPGDTGDSTDQSLWLDEIRHTGKRGTPLTLDPVRLTGEFMANRVDSGSDSILPLHKPRLKTIVSEAGALTVVDYQPAQCVAGQTMPKADTNTRTCYPVYWSPNGEKTPILDWFQKYPVVGVRTNDTRGGSQAVQHTYVYEGGGAWHYNEDPMTPEKERTWSTWRGFGKVTHLTGATGKTQSKTVTVYLRGMNGDRVLGSDGKLPHPDTRKTVQVTGIKAPALTDSEQFAGYTRESVTYNGAQEVSGTVNLPWSKRTATQHKSYADTEAHFVRTASTQARTTITTSGTATDRTRTTATTYDDYGMAATVEDRGDDKVTGDEKCTRTWYARNDAAGINSLVSRTRTVGKPCATTDAELDLPVDSSRPGDVLGDTATAYDSTTWSATQQPTKGEAQWTGRAKGYGIDDQPVWQKVATTTYDVLGRPLTVRDTKDTQTAATTYTPAATGPLTSTTVANAAGHTTTTAIDFATGTATKVTDANGGVTETEYDSLGRLTQVWLPDNLRVLGSKASQVYTYSIKADSLPWVSTATLKGDGSGYNTTYEIFDSLLRPRQVQSPSASGGRVIALTQYDERGLAVSAQSDIWDNANAPSGVLVATDGGQAPVQTDTTYDGAGRAIKAVTKNYNVVRWTTETTYTGDTVTSTAPAGGQATAVVTNALGQTTERREYGGPQPTGGAFTKTAYTYTPAGQQSLITGPDGAKWSYSYDLFGRQVGATDPDKGTSTTTYNELDQVTATTDSRGRSLLSLYDVLGRRIGLWDGSLSNSRKLTGWSYDTLAKGQQDTAERYENGIKQTTSKAYIKKVTDYDLMYRAVGSTLQLPADDPLVAAGVPSTLTFTTGYNLDGTVKQAGSPAVAGLAAETLGYGYDFDGVGLQQKLTGSTGYLQNALYTPLGDLNRLDLANSPTAKQTLYLGYQYEDGTRRLKNSLVTSDVHAYQLQNASYTQDDAGNVTSVFDDSTLGGTGKTDNQCFTYDGHRRLKEAWTPRTADCAATGRTVANLDGAAPYWTSYAYNTAGQRTSETEHTASGDKTTTYTYGTTAAQPHPLAKTTGAKNATYAYDPAGNTTSRPGTQAQQTLTWNSEGKLVGTTEPAAGTKPALGTSYLYDASGELLIRRNTTADGDTVLYLGSTEVRLTTKGTTKTLTGTRYYTAAGKTIAVRTATAGAPETKLSFLASDHHGTSSLAVDATTLAITRRFTTPFGAPRGTAPTAWPDDKAFLGKPADKSTGLTHIGAREYDPGIGLFISVDPLLELDKHQTLNGYSYSINNPLTFSDPSGMGLACGDDDIPCPTRPDGTKGNGRPNEAATGTGKPPKGSTTGGSGGTASESGGSYRQSYEEEKDQYANEDLSAKFQAERMAQISAGAFGIRDAVDSAGDAQHFSCRGKGGDAAFCRGVEEAWELAMWNDVRKAVQRIDESWASPENIKKNNGRGFTDKEYELAFYLAMNGRKNVMSRNDTDGAGDAWVDAKRSEFKAPTSRNAIQTRLKKAHTQNVDHVYLDVRGTGLQREDVERAVRGQVKSFVSGPTFAEVWAVGGDSHPWDLRVYG
ncbi:RHS repeat-associated core domain-containing protein [Streptomyces sp. NPDC006307]|uniref:RHS repeat-associated core domain-containing protein n=1 Tax=Streptomyces sp. NPDC006307 TaxID=3156748 RepID=UPI0033A9A50E